MSGRQLHLGLNAPTGVRGSGWRRPGADPLGAANVEYYLRLAQNAERGLFDAFFINDQPVLHPGWETSPAPPRLEPLIALASVAQHTERIGLVGTLSTTFNHPYNLARAVGSLDRASHGRAGWNVLTSYNPQIAANFGEQGLLSKQERYARAREFVEVVIKLWQTWAPGSIVADKQSGRFADPAKVRSARHHGDHFSVSGGLAVPSSEQGLPVLLQAGASDEGLDLAARYADAAFVSAPDFDLAVDYRRRLGAASAVRPAGRMPVLSLPGATLVLASTQGGPRPAGRKAWRLTAPPASRTWLAAWGCRRTRSTSTHRSRSSLSMSSGASARTPKASCARSRQPPGQDVPSGRSVRDGTGHLQIVGSPKTVADLFERWFAAGVADGFTLMFDVIDDGLPLFVAEVVPILQDRGLFRRAYGGKTLREHLGLPIPRW
jgi:FMN-dependent oxidoreductase (nitrilotriacetate monooxygenase family)